jgi:glucose/arabinose dehydrogenase
VGRSAAYAVEQFGRLRTVAVAPDGSLWVVTSNTDGRATPREGDDRIVRVTLRAAG